MYRSGVKGIALFLVVVSVLFLACEKEVKINLNTGPAKLVVDGQIETGGVPLVILTKSIGYFSKIDLGTLENSFVHGATVTVSDGLSSVSLKEYSLDTGINGTNKFFLYSVDTAGPAALNFRGVLDGNYLLTIQYEGYTYESVT